MRSCDPPSAYSDTKYYADRAERGLREQRAYLVRASYRFSRQTIELGESCGSEVGKSPDASLLIQRRGQIDARP